MKQQAQVVVGYLRDQFQRRWRRLKRPIRILKAFREYSRRRALAGKSQAAKREERIRLQASGQTEISLREELSRPLIDAAREKLATAKSLPQRRSKAFFSQLLSAEDRGLDDVYMRVALDEELLDIAASYLGGTPFLESVELLFSRPVGNGAPVQSQLWHRDRTDAAILKLFVYITDVGDRNGPFIFLPKQHSGNVPWYLPHYIDDERMERYAPVSEAVTVKGKAGTAFLIDTANCYHLGSRCEEPRLAYVVYYSSGFGYYPRESSWDVSDDEKARLSETQRLALGAYGG